MKTPDEDNMEAGGDTTPTPLPPPSPPHAAFVPAVYTDFLLNNAVMLVSETSRGIVLSSFFHYLGAMTMGGSAGSASLGSAAENGDALELGVTTALFSIGRLLGNILLGRWAEHASIRVVLAGCLLLHAAGQALYFAAYLTPSVWVLVASRLVIGFGSSTLGVNRSFVTLTVPSNMRTAAFAWLSASKFVGYAITPGLGIVMNNANWSLPNSLRIDTFTLPGLVMCAACFLLVPPVLLYMSPVAVNEDPQKGGARGGGLAGKHSSSSGSSTYSIFPGTPFPLSLNAAGMVDEVQEPSSTPAREEEEGEGGRRGCVGRLVDCVSLTPARPAGASLVRWRLFQFGTLIFILLNVATKGALTLCEVIIAPTFSALYNGPPDQVTSATSTYLMYLGVAGLLPFAALVLKPSAKDAARGSRSRRSSTGDPASAAAFGGTSAREPCMVGCKLALSRAFHHCASFAIEYDSLLLIASQVITAGGLVLLALPVASVSLDMTTAGFVLVWSLAGPVADVLTVSMYSVLLSDLGLREQVARSMATITAAGSVGRIVFPLLFSVTSQADVLAAGAAVSVACAVLALAYVAGTPNRAAETLRARLGLSPLGIDLDDDEEEEEEEEDERRQRLLDTGSDDDDGLELLRVVKVLEFKKEGTGTTSPTVG
jgi:MFS family permease